MIAAVVLAAGASSRMGSPKALLEAAGETFIDRLIGVFAVHCAPVVTVLGYQAETIRAGMRRAHETNIVVNPRPEKGQLSSLQCGFAAVPEEAEAVFFTPVDHPGIRAATLAALIDAFRSTGARAVVPAYHGRHGHPVLCSRELVAELAALPAGARARDAVHSPGAVYVKVEDAGTVQDIDDPEAYRAFAASRGAA